jgi:hypothetical protein
LVGGEIEVKVVVDAVGKLARARVWPGREVRRQSRRQSDVKVEVEGRMFRGGWGRGDGFDTVMS